MLGAIPVVGYLFKALGSTAVWALSAPPELVVSGLKSAVGFLFGTL